MAAKTREATKRETREKLIDTGISLIGERGLDVPLDTLCERAGYTRGAFYVHFADRDDFLRAVMDKLGGRFLDAVLGTVGDEADVLTVAARFVEAVGSGAYPLMRTGKKRGGVRPHQLLDACMRSKPIRERYVALANESVARVARAVERGQADAIVRRDVDPKTVASLALAAIIGAQTMTELEIPFDLPSASATFALLLAARG